MRQTTFAIPIVFVAFTSTALAQPSDAVRLTENFAKDAQYHVACQVEISGVLSIADAKDGKLRALKVAGKSSLKYDERILRVTNGKVERTVRYYRQLEFERKINDEEQRSRLRPEAARLVI